MRRTLTVLVALIMLHPLLAQTPDSRPSARLSGEAQTVIGPTRGPWRRLFLDAMVVEESQNLSRIFHAAEKHPANPVLRRDKPWEEATEFAGPYLYGTVMWDAGKLRMWYQCLRDGDQVCYAESQDGLSWTKPGLGIIEFNGSKDNNLVIARSQSQVTGGSCHLPSVIKRVWEAGSTKQYALFGYDRAVGARVAFSPDGLRWQFAPKTAEKPLFTSSDVLSFFWDPYRSRYTATWKCGSRRGRSVGVAWSQDGMTWTKPVDGPVFVPDDLDPDATQIYGMPVFPYQGLYISLPWIYHARFFKDGEYTVEKMREAQSDSPRTVDVQLAWSHDLINWTRPPQRQPFIPRGAAGEFDSGMIYTARAPVLVGDRLFFYSAAGTDRTTSPPRAPTSVWRRCDWTASAPCTRASKKGGSSRAANGCACPRSSSTRRPMTTVTSWRKFWTGATARCPASDARTVCRSKATPCGTFCSGKRRGSRRSNRRAIRRFVST